MAAIPNVWHLRRVAEAQQSAFPSETSVPHSPDVNGAKDFFYVCPGHMKDRGFATPIVDEAEVVAKRRKEEMEQEIQKVKFEYEEKIKNKKAKDKGSKDAKKDEKHDKKEKAKREEEEQQAEKEKDDRVRPVAGPAQL
ncbi:uncharacterized protein KY384_006882 [Bacidia gigantensis]|uniref:uncharacterized protein n=1 Tax=Bacidia gigantensis TaxID=2732470 RepID=UPI001D04E0D4|nr:uncharacterized protein KY384_006882 [Bacidia gigantensis]KAG8527966.1 hypothetical protein KY384_006882 [Bacidia gigantensis]